MKSNSASVLNFSDCQIAELPDDHELDGDDESDEAKPRALTFGNFFSGMECPLTALEMASSTSHIPRDVKPRFACEISKQASLSRNGCTKDGVDSSRAS